MYYHPQPAGGAEFQEPDAELISCQVYEVKAQLDVTKEILRNRPARESTVRRIEVHRFFALCNLFITETKFDHTGQSLRKTTLMTDQWKESLEIS